MELVYKKATIKDIEILTKSRVQVLIAANKLPENTNMENVKEKSYEYYREALKDGSHTAYLVFDGEILVGTGGEYRTFCLKQQTWGGYYIKSTVL